MIYSIVISNNLRKLCLEKYSIHSFISLNTHFIVMQMSVHPRNVQHTLKTLFVSYDKNTISILYEIKWGSIVGKMNLKILSLVLPQC